MQTLAAAFGVGRTTLYRWVGDREQLIASVVAQLADENWVLAAERAEGTGIDRAVDTARRFMETSSTFPPLREFAQHEPGLALRILMSPDGLVGERIRAGFADALAAYVPNAAITPELLDTAVQIGTALESAPIIIGEEPAIERALHLARTLIETNISANKRTARRAVSSASK